MTAAPSPPALPDAARPHVVVVGAGIAGLAAAFELTADGAARVTVLEGASRTGGKLVRGEVAGVLTDFGAESVLARRPEGLGLLAELGLADQIVHPATTQAAVWSRGALRPLPVGHVMGVPSDVRALAASGVVSPLAAARASLDLVLPRTPIGDDTSVAAFVGARMGRSVVDRLVEPLLGGVYAGRADELSLRATLPQVAGMAGGGGGAADSGGGGRSRSLLRSLRDRPAAASSAPVFAGLPGGVGRLGELLTEAIVAQGAELRLDAAVRELRRTPDGWRLAYGSAAHPQTIEADAVVLALPAAPAARLLALDVPAAATDLAAIEYASMAIVTFAFNASAIAKPLSGSGFLVPAVEGRLIKATTYSSQKWGWYGSVAPDLVLLRCSIGRHGDVADLQHTDDELIAGALRDLAHVVGVRGVPRDAQVTRWGGALPQYSVGHLGRVARIKAAVAAAPALAICGAAFDGVGIPACIGSGRTAATQVLRGTLGGRQWAHESAAE